MIEQHILYEAAASTIIVCVGVRCRNGKTKSISIFSVLNVILILTSVFAIFPKKTCGQDRTLVDPGFFDTRRLFRHASGSH